MRYAQGVSSRFQTWLYLLGLTTAVFTGCTNKAAQQGFERPPAPVSVTEAVMQDVPNYIDAIGKTVAREVVSIQPQVSGRILKIHFTDGANVKKGDLLFTIDTRIDPSKTPAGVPRNEVADVVTVCQGPSHLGVRRMEVDGPEGRGDGGPHRQGPDREWRVRLRGEEHLRERGPGSGGERADDKEQCDAKEHGQGR